MSKRRRPGAGRRIAEQRFWGDAGQSTAATAAAGSPDSGSATSAPEIQPIRPTSDPAAVVRSLGPAPLGVDAAVVERHLTAVYEEAVRAATALAAANGLLAAEEAEEEGGGDG